MHVTSKEADLMTGANLFTVQKGAYHCYRKLQRKKASMDLLFSPILIPAGTIKSGSRNVVKQANNSHLMNLITVLVVKHT